MLISLYKYVKKIVDIFTIDLEALERELIIMCIRSKGGYSRETILKLPYWRYINNIGIFNDLDKESEQSQPDTPDVAGAMGSFNPSSIMNSMSSMANKFK